MVACIEPLPPDKARVGAAVVCVGRVGFALLSAVADRGGTSARGLKVRLWNDPDAPQNRLKVLLNRINRRLASAGCPLRVRLDAGNVLLC